MRNYKQLCDYIPEIEHDGMSIKYREFTHDEVMWEKVRNMRDYWMVMGLKADYRYTVLRKDGAVWMSDTPMERNTNKLFMDKAHGDVLVYGLGIGLILFPLLEDPEISSITVVEIDQRMIDFVSPLIKKHDTFNKLTVIHGDAFEHHKNIPKGKKYHTVYFDIWVNICTDNYEEILKLEKAHRKFVDYKSGKAFLGSWMKSYYQKEIRKEKREQRLYDSYFNSHNKFLTLS